VLQNVHSNYEIDLFQSLIKAAMAVTGCTDIENRSLRVIADHLRSSAFLIVDGINPSNEGRGYVLRRIIRRAIRHAYKLGCDELFMYRLVDSLVAEMGEAYPELGKQADQVKQVIRNEEEQFARTLENGMAILETGIAELSATEIPGELVFKLYDTFGFPADLTADVAREKNLGVDMDGFERLMAEQRLRAKSANKFKLDRDIDLNLDGQTTFFGYESLLGDGCVVKLLRDGVDVTSLAEGETGMVVLDGTPFYAESGGQAGDRGQLTALEAQMQVVACNKLQGHHLHQVVVQQGRIRVGDRVTAQVVREERLNTARHHSATHLMHAALRQLLGEHVQQRGSLVTFDKLRFDFSHLESLTPAQLRTIEQMVNQQVLANTAVITEVTDIDTARASGAMALFGEKYADQVRVLSMGEDGFSKELCGGTHVERTGDLGLFRILSESGIAAGVRRIEAVVGPYALAQIYQQDELLIDLQQVYKCTPDQLTDKAQQALVQIKALEKDIQRLSAKQAAAIAGDLSVKAVDINGVKVLAVQMQGIDANALRTTMDELKSSLGSAIIVIAAVNGDKVQLAAGVTKDLVTRVKAGDLVRELGALMGAKGGGKPDLAMAGGGDVTQLQAALDQAEPWVRHKLGA